jgi:hypothetical protein
MIEANAFRTFIGIYSLFRSECLSTSIKLTFHKSLIRSVMTCTCPAWELAAGIYLLIALKTAAPLNFSKMHTSLRFAHSFQTSICTFIRLYNRIVQATSRSHTKS